MMRHQFSAMYPQGGGLLEGDMDPLFGALKCCIEFLEMLGKMVLKLLE
jgi:hypothetical protein